MFRAVVALVGDPVTGLFTTTPAQVASFLVSFVSFILLTFGLILMVNQRLNAEMREAKEYSELLFNTSPGAVLITNLANSHLVDVNDEFMMLTGFNRAEVIGKSTTEVNLWKNPEDRK